MNQPFDQLTIGPLTLRNRFVKTATNEGCAKGGTVTAGLARFHEEVAEGGAALSTVAYCAVSRDGRTFVDQVTMEPAALDDLKALTASVHRHGGAISAQLTHAGCFTFLPADELETRKPWSASGGFNKVGVMSSRWFKQAMDRDAMDQVADEFVRAALLAQEAGFDAVELHMGHGYLLSQFLSPLYNKRSDSYGGSIENRLKYPCEVLAKVLDAVGERLAVVVKFSMTDGVRSGNTIAEGVAIAKAIEAQGAHLAVLSNGLNVESITAMFGSSFPKANRGKSPNLVVAAGMFIQSFTEPKHVEFKENYLHDHALEIRRAVQMPLAYLGGVDSAQGIAGLLNEGFDCVAMGRALLREPDAVARMEGGEEWISSCNRCNRCVTAMYGPAGTYCVLDSAPDATLNTVPARQHA